MPQGERGRWAILGSWRFLLALIVASNHLPVFISLNYNGGGILPFLQLFPGTGAVLVFFVISGYSIAASLERQRRGFYRRRWLRVFPLYWLVVIASAFIPLLFGGKVEAPRVVYYTPSLGDVVTNLFCLQGFFVDAINTDRAVWSLSVEVFLYLFAPLLFEASTSFIWALIGISIGSYVASKTLIVPQNFYRYGGNALTLAWTWLLGFWVHRRRGDRFSIYVSVALGLVPGCFSIPGFLVIWAGAVTMMKRRLSWECPSVLLRVFNKMGDISYPLYLAHIPFFTLIFALGLKASSWSIVLLIVLSCCLDYFYDQPIKRIVRALRTV